MAHRLRVAYIGAGAFSNRCIYPQLAAHDVELTAVCDLVEERARAAARQYGFGAVYTDFRKMLEAERPDVVICVGGPVVHYEVGREVLDRGYPLYVQKSPAPTSAQVRELANMAAERGVVCHVGFNLRSCVAGATARKVLANAEFGRPALIIVRYGLVSGATRRDAVMDQHCHAFDLLRWLGGEVAEMTVKLGRVAGDRGYVAAVRFESGAVGTVNFTSAQAPDREFVYFEVTGRQGHYLMSHDFDLRVLAPDRPEEILRRGNYGAPLAELSWLGYVADLASFFAAVRGEADDICPVADTVNTMALCEEAYRQLRQQGAEE